MPPQMIILEADEVEILANHIFNIKMVYPYVKVLEKAMN